MFKSLTRFVAAMVASSALLAASESRACCFCDWFHCGAPATCAPTTYATQYVAPTCNVCPQQVSYVPQTNYTTQYQCMPVTSCQPVASCDPCGGSQTVMRPVTTYVRRPVMVPYTSYRPVVTSLNYAAPACSSCGSAPYYGGAGYAATAVAAPSTGCATCGGGMSAGYGAVQAGYAAPVAGAPMPGTPMYANTAPGMATQGMVAGPAVAGAAMGGPAMSAPTMNGPSFGTPTPAAPNYNSQPNTFQPNNSTPNSTFQQNGSGTPSSSQMPPMQPIPDTDKTNSSMAPRFPDAQNRTTSTGPMIGPAVVMPAIFNTAQRPFVFHPASTQTIQPSTDGFSTNSTSASSANNDGWESTGSR